MKPQEAHFVVSQKGQEALENLQRDFAKISAADEIKIISRLRKELSMQEAAAVMEVAKARQRAVESGKFSQAEHMFFTREALEQSSGEAISLYRAERFKRALPADSLVADFCCGIGGDTTGLLQYFRVDGYDLDEGRLCLATANASVYSHGDKFTALCQDVTSVDASKYQGAFFDPARRDAQGKRIYDPQKYGPPLSTVLKWLPDLPGQALGVKISPGIDYETLADYDCEIEIISQDGDVKEAVLWFGTLRSQGKPRHRATLLISSYSNAPGYSNSHCNSNAPGNSKLAIITYDDAAEVPPLPVDDLGKYIHEPDGAIIRAGLVELLGPQLNAHKIDEDIAYLTGDTPSTSPSTKSFEVLDHLPFSLKQLKERLVKLGCQSVTVKKRGSPITPEELIKSLALKSGGKSKKSAGTSAAKHKGEELIVFLTRLKGEHSAIIARAC